MYNGRVEKTVIVFGLQYSPKLAARIREIVRPQIEAELLDGETDVNRNPYVDDLPYIRIKTEFVSPPNTRIMRSIIAKRKPDACFSVAYYVDGSRKLYQVAV